MGHKGATCFLVAVLALVGLDAQKQDDTADTARLIEVLGIREGAKVADILNGCWTYAVPSTGHGYKTSPSSKARRHRLIFPTDAATRFSCGMCIIISAIRL